MQKAVAIGFEDIKEIIDKNRYYIKNTIGSWFCHYFRNKGNRYLYADGEGMPESDESDRR